MRLRRWQAVKSGEMSAPFLKAIDWQRPWLSPLLPAAMPVVQAAAVHSLRSNWRQALNAAAVADALQNHRGMPIRFVPQADLPPDTAYEAFISATGSVPTRDNLHDFFNALVWLTFPGIKAQLNALQSAEIARSAAATSDVTPAHAGRGKLRDAATIFDENAALLIARDRSLVDALRAHRWREVFMTRRTAFQHDCEVWLFGHALIEKLVSPYKAITAHAWVVIADDAFFALPPREKQTWIDASATRQLAHGLATSAFTPLPVLGVPGWWDNQDDLFYDDATVFRPKRGAGR
jgi:hypothetical protein